MQTSSWVIRWFRITVAGLGPSEPLISKVNSFLNGARDNHFSKLLPLHSDGFCDCNTRSCYLSGSNWPGWGAPKCMTIMGGIAFIHLLFPNINNSPQIPSTAKLLTRKLTNVVLLPATMGAPSIRCCNWRGGIRCKCCPTVTSASLFFS